MYNATWERLLSFTTLIRLLKSTVLTSNPVLSTSKMAAPDADQHGLKFKRKRKKSFLQNAKGFGKKGKFGHGTQLDQDTYDYFIRVLELLKGDFDNPTDKDALVQNALDQTESHEIDQSSNQVGARVIEALIKLAKPAALLRFMDVFSSNLRVVATNRFASHVLQSLIARVAKFALDGVENNSVSQDIGSELKAEDSTAWVLKIARFVLNNLDDFVWDEYANFVIRTVLLSLAGVPPCEVDSNWSASQNQRSSVPLVFTTTAVKTEDDVEPVEVSLPEGFKDVLKEFYLRISSWPQFSDLAFSNATSALLQTLLTALSKTHPKLKKKLIKLLIDQSFCAGKSEEDDKKDSDQNSALSAAFSTDASIRLLETALELASSKYVTQIYAMCFMGRLVDLATDQATNFAVQKLLANISDKNEFETLFEELTPGLDKILTSGKSGVLLALCQACKRLSAKQGPFIEQLMKALDCLEPADRRPLLVPLTVRLSSYENFKSQVGKAGAESVAKDGVSKSKFNLHGSLLVQTMLTFNKPIKVVNSLLEMPGSELKSLMCDTKGCHIMDALVKSEFVGEKSRERLLHRLLGSYVALACSKHGSRALEALYAVSTQKNQMKIMEELAGREALVTATDSGRIIANKWSLDMFRHRRNDWKQLQSRKERTKDLFADIIGPLQSKQT